MPGFRIQSFEGEIPRVADHLLPDNAARIATNVDMISGDLVPIRKPQQVAEINCLAATLYRLRSYQGHLWLTWEREVNAVPGPIAKDTSGRTYYTGDAEPRVTDYILASSGGSGPYPRTKYALGVPHPRNAPTLTALGTGSSPNITRAYVTTFVTQWGEESAPSNASTITIQTGQAVVLSNMGDIPPNSGNITALTYSGLTVTITTTAPIVNRAGDEITVAGVTTVANVNGTWVLTSVNEAAKTMTFKVNTSPTGTYDNTIDTSDTWTRVAPWNTSNLKRRIYRTQVGSTATEYQLVDEIPAADTTYTDSKTDNQLEATLLPSLEWDLPPSDLKGLVSLPGGFFAGISGNQLCFSEPYQPHAWPRKYRRTIAYRGVALGVFGSTLVVGTEGRPYIAQGVDPETMSVTMAGVEFPCVSARGMVSTDNGVLYPSHDGLVYIGVNGTELTTASLLSRANWQALTPTNLFAVWHAGRYYGCYFDTQNRIIIIGDKVTRSDIQSTALFSDPVDGNLYFVHNNAIYRWNANPNDRMTMDWLSKRFLVPTPLTMTAAEVIADFEITTEEIEELETIRQAIIDSNAALMNADVGGSLNSEPLVEDGYAINDSVLQYVPGLFTKHLSFRLFVDGELKFIKAITPETKTFSMPSGYRAKEFAVQLTGNVRVHSVAIAGNRIGLKQV